MSIFHPLQAAEVQLRQNPYERGILHRAILSRGRIGWAEGFRAGFTYRDNHPELTTRQAVKTNADESYWAELPEELIPVDRLVWDKNHMSMPHIRALLHTPNPEPIRVEQLYDGRYFIHNGRHRAHRALLDGADTIAAKVHRK